MKHEQLTAAVAALEPLAPFMTNFQADKKHGISVVVEHGEDAMNALDKLKPGVKYRIGMFGRFVATIEDWQDGFTLTVFVQ